MSSRASRMQIAERAELAEDLLCAGMPPGTVERKVAEKYAVSTRQARKSLEVVYERWRQQSASDAPHRREKTLRMAERFFMKALSAEQYGAAVTALGILAKLSGALIQHDPERNRRLAELGQPSADPTQALLYAQRVMVFTLAEVAVNEALDPERRMRWIAELGSKLGMTHAKALFENRLALVEERLGLAEKSEHADELQPTASGDTALRTRVALPERKPVH